jgi:tRNA (cmo5U34)-methyltransferase
MTHVTEVFNEHAGGYDAERRRLIPPFDSFYGTAVDAIRLCGAESPRILDLGAGTGLLSMFIRTRYPTARLTLLDGATAMLEKARATLGDADVTYMTANLKDPLPGGPWDAVVSALAIHHLSDEDKRTLFGRTRAALSPGGVFVNAEQVAGSTPLLTKLYASWHESRARAAGSDDPEWSAALGRMAHDHCADVESQLVWLRAAGFAHADCLFKDHGFAVMIAC